MVQKIHLTNFRNFEDKIFSFDDKVTVIVGPNGSGKTNILESLFLTSTGKSFKAKVEEEMVNYEADVARVKTKIDTGILEIFLTKNSKNLQPGKQMSRKKMTVGGVSKRLVDFAGNLKVVLFGPWDMDLVTASPSLRRKFLDIVLSQIDREYRRALLSYEKGLRQRNKLLWQIRELGGSRTQLTFWNQLLIKNGDYISKSREDFINFVNSNESPITVHYSLIYDKSAISESRLDEYKNEEIAAATTLVGPHRDDFTFLEETKELAKFGSRGEQRMAVLWLKLAELSFIEKTSGEKPTLLLDDIFSELDHKHRDVVMKASQNQQTIITTADEHFIEDFNAKSIISLLDNKNPRV